MSKDWKWAANWSQVAVWVFCAIAFAAGVLGIVSYLSLANWCQGEGCTIQGWLGAVSGSFATIFALAAVVVAAQALRLQRLATETQLRAYLFLDRAEYDAKADVIYLAIRNCGSTPALGIEIVQALDVVDDRNCLIQPSTNTKFHVGIMGPNKFNTLDWTGIAAKRCSDLPDLHSGAKHVCIGGRVLYDDIFGTSHQLTFQTALSSDGKRFRRKLDLIHQTSVTAVQRKDAHLATVINSTNA